MTREISEIIKLPTGVEGLDHITNGGLPKGRSTLVSGTAGSAKTVLAAQFLAAGVSVGEPGVFVTFEEKPADIRRNLQSFGWDVAQWEAQGKWSFVDASAQPHQEDIVSGHYDLGALMARIEHAVNSVGAARVSIDSLGAVFVRLLEMSTMRSELARILAMLTDMGVTSIITMERNDEYGSIARYGIEEFVADNVLILRNALEQEKRRRTVEILKFRGTTHQKGEYPFTILPDKGIVVIPVSAIELKQPSTDIRITSGIEGLDDMCDGGFFRDSIILVSGATGTGKTLMVTQFLGGGVGQGERCLLLAFEESREQLFRNAEGWGVDFEAMERQGLLKVICRYPETGGLEDHLVEMIDAMEQFKPQRVAVDSLSALERVSTIKGFREFVISLSSYIKREAMAGLFTNTTPTLLGGTSVTESHISTITDSIILLRYVEMHGEMRRGLTVLKMRGSHHDKEIREFTIDGAGLHLGKPFRNIAGILAGMPSQVMPGEIERLNEMFK